MRYKPQDKIRSLLSKITSYITEVHGLIDKLENSAKKEVNVKKNKKSKKVEK